MTFFQNLFFIPQILNDIKLSRYSKSEYDAVLKLLSQDAIAKGLI